ncbi:TIGR03564 family F420-dependent LLM class oxidoreductase [Mycolicibacterium stellerae]|uniref:TIGR03564 family F420-dependent LLM class oxidoreductase n=1 Tax=Mycolicibacterium stellerae TaxID=2358193 RepID=UPI000F0B10C3|nr:TIGR03564 family F420-dependent LLM class oxidoreductase [Mycolicibacterium stellerae]
MRISRFFSPTVTLTDYVDLIVGCEAAGFDGAWIPDAMSWDALTVSALVGARTSTLRVGTAVVPAYPSHPLTLAGKAMSTQAAAGGRFTLGLGTSHQFVVEQVWGMSFARPRQFMSEYLDILIPAMQQEQVAFHGEQLTGALPRALVLPGVQPPPVFLAAMGPAMLRLAGAHADGTITWLTGPRTLADHIVPTITTAAAEAGRPAPTIVAGLPVCVTNDVEDARKRAAVEYQVYDNFPSYRAMLDREGHAVAGDVALIGSAAQIAESVHGLREAGVTEMYAEIFGTDEEIAATVEVLTGLARSQSGPNDAALLKHSR